MALLNRKHSDFHVYGQEETGPSAASYMTVSIKTTGLSPPRPPTSSQPFLLESITESR